MKPLILVLASSLVLQSLVAEEIKDFAAQYGLPIAIKAAFGGGGRGLKVARTEAEIEECYDSDRSGDIGCVNPEFHELPVGKPTFKVFAQLTD